MFTKLRRSSQDVARYNCQILRAWESVKGWRSGSPFVSRAGGIEIEVPVNRALSGADALDINIQVLFEHDLVLRQEVAQEGKY